MGEMTAKDRHAAYEALITWFESQEIDTLSAFNVLMVLMAKLIWLHSNSDPVKAAKLADAAHLDIVRHLGVTMADELEKFFANKKDQ